MRRETNLKINQRFQFSVAGGRVIYHCTGQGFLWGGPSAEEQGSSGVRAKKIRDRVTHHPDTSGCSVDSRSKPCASVMWMLRTVLLTKSSFLLLSCAPPPTHHLRRTMTSTAAAKTTATTALAATMRGERSYAALAESLTREIVDAVDPSPERANDVLSALQREWARSRGDNVPAAAADDDDDDDDDRAKKETPSSTIELLEATGIGKVLTKAIRSCKRHGRTSDERDGWDAAVKIGGETLASMKAAADDEARVRSASASSSSSSSAVAGAGATTATATATATEAGLPSSTADFRARLVRQGKEMYKDPPSAPPVGVVVETKSAPCPKRNASTGELTFASGVDTGLAEKLRDFHPNRTPEEVLRAGSFGGTYFRAITSAVTNARYVPSSVLGDTVRPEWISGLDKASLLASGTYRASVNKYGVKCGGSLGMWESSGWISDADPYGWFQWYCRFYSGRRCSDDARQISRWMGVAGKKGRFRSQLCNKIIAAGTTSDDARISPVIRQTLLHWGLEITEDVLERHRRR